MSISSRFYQSKIFPKYTVLEGFHQKANRNVNKEIMHCFETKADRCPICTRFVLKNVQQNIRYFNSAYIWIMFTCRCRYKTCISNFNRIGLVFSQNITVRTLNTCGRGQQWFCYTLWVNDPLIKFRKTSLMLSSYSCFPLPLKCTWSRRKCLGSFGTTSMVFTPSWRIPRSCR